MKMGDIDATVISVALMCADDVMMRAGRHADAACHDVGLPGLCRRLGNRDRKPLPCGSWSYGPAPADDDDR